MRKNKLKQLFKDAKPIINSWLAVGEEPGFEKLKKINKGQQSKGY
jgi:hypothetical protein